MAIKILGTGAYVPEKIVTNDDLAKMVETSDEWITQRVGIKERRVSVNETAADFAVNAAKEAMANADITADELDLIIAATISAENICPTVAGTVQNKIGATCPALYSKRKCQKHSCYRNRTLKQACGLG